MTDEEISEEYLRKGVCQGCSSICEGDCAYAKPVRQAHLDGLAEGRKEKWHDLREDPNDLPKENGKYIIHIKVSERISITDTCDFFNGSFGRFFNPIAWCEIPKFEEKK